MTTLEVLKAARATIEQGWAINAMARDAAGIEVDEDSETAVCWCANGALALATPPGPCGRTGDEFYVPFKAAQDSLKRAIGIAERASLAEWNDRPGRTQADVLAAFDKAIAAEEAKP